MPQTRPLSPLYPLNSIQLSRYSITVRSTLKETLALDQMDTRPYRKRLSVLIYVYSKKRRKIACPSTCPTQKPFNVENIKHSARTGRHILVHPQIYALRLATDWNVRGLNSCSGKSFFSPKPATQEVGPIHPSIKWLQGFFSRGINRRDHEVFHHLHILLRLRMNGAKHPLPLYVFMERTRTTLPLLFILECKWEVFILSSGHILHPAYRLQPTTVNW